METTNENVTVDKSIKIDQEMLAKSGYRGGGKAWDEEKEHLCITVKEFYDHPEATGHTFVNMVAKIVGFSTEGIDLGEDEPNKFTKIAMRGRPSAGYIFVDRKMN